MHVNKSLPIVLLPEMMRPSRIRRLTPFLQQFFPDSPRNADPFQLFHGVNFEPFPRRSKSLKGTVPALPSLLKCHTLLSKAANSPSSSFNADSEELLEAVQRSRSSSYVDAILRMCIESMNIVQLNFAARCVKKFLDSATDWPLTTELPIDNFACNALMVTAICNEDLYNMILNERLKGGNDSVSQVRGTAFFSWMAVQAMCHLASLNASTSTPAELRAKARVICSLDPACGADKSDSMVNFLFPRLVSARRRLLTQNYTTFMVTSDAYKSQFESTHEQLPMIAYIHLLSTCRIKLSRNAQYADRAANTAVKYFKHYCDACRAAAHGGSRPHWAVLQRLFGSLAAAGSTCFVDTVADDLISAPKSLRHTKYLVSAALGAMSQSGDVGAMRRHAPSLLNGGLLKKAGIREQEQVFHLFRALVARCELHGLPRTTTDEVTGEELTDPDWWQYALDQRLWARTNASRVLLEHLAHVQSRAPPLYPPHVASERAKLFVALRMFQALSNCDARRGVTLTDAEVSSLEHWPDTFQRQLAQRSLSNSAVSNCTSSADGDVVDIVAALHHAGVLNFIERRFLISIFVASHDVPAVAALLADASWRPTDAIIGSSVQFVRQLSWMVLNAQGSSIANANERHSECALFVEKAIRRAIKRHKELGKVLGADGSIARFPLPKRKRVLFGSSLRVETEKGDSVTPPPLPLHDAVGPAGLQYNLFAPTAFELFDIVEPTMETTTSSAATGPLLDTQSAEEGNAQHSAWEIGW